MDTETRTSARMHGRAFAAGWYRARAELRTGWRSAVALGLLVAVVGGAVLTAAAGARRTGQAFPHLVAQSRPAELLVAPDVPVEEAAAGYRLLDTAPEVAGTTNFIGVPANPQAGTPSARFAESFYGLGVVAPLDSGLGREIDRPRLLAGRLPEPTAAEEVLLSERFAATTGLAVGDELQLVLLTEEVEGVSALTTEADQGMPLRLSVVGVGLFADEVVPFTSFAELGFILGTKALAEMVTPELRNFDASYVDLVDGADAGPLSAELTRLGFSVDNQSVAAVEIERALQPLSVALWVVTGLLGVVALVVVGQGMARANWVDAATQEALAALGVSRVGDVVSAALRTVVVSVAGAVGAVGVAVATAGLFPIGPVRRGETALWPHLDVAVLAGGAALLIVGTVLAVLPSAARRSRRGGTASAHPGRTGRGFSSRTWRAGLSPAAGEGMRWALARSAGRGAPLGSTIAAIAVATAAAVGAATFGASLSGLVEHPDRYGQRWDRTLDGAFAPISGAIVTALAEDPRTRAVAVGRYGDLTIGTHVVPAISLRSVKGDVSVGLLEGAAADDRGEVVFGAATARELGVRVGDQVQADGPDGPTPYSVVGIGVFPRFGQGGFLTTGLGVGAQVAAGLEYPSYSEADAARLTPGDYVDGGLYSFAAVDLAGSAEAMDGRLRELIAASQFRDLIKVVDAATPRRIRDLDRVQGVPVAAAGLLALLALAALAHLLIAVVRERSAELALLRALGFQRREVRRAVSWHAVVVASGAVAIGAPLGVVTGRLAWRLLATDLDIEVVAVTPALTLALLPALTLIAGAGVALVPARIATRASDRPVREDP